MSKIVTFSTSYKIEDVKTGEEAQERAEELLLKDLGLDHLVDIFDEINIKDGEKRLNTERLASHVLASIRGKLSPDLDEDNKSLDDKINEMGNSELFRSWLIWYGIIGYEAQIREAVENIFGVKLR